MGLRDQCVKYALAEGGHAHKGPAPSGAVCLFDNAGRYWSRAYAAAKIAQADAKPGEVAWASPVGHTRDLNGRVGAFDIRYEPAD